MNRYEILDANGNVTNTIIADQAFMEANYPDGNYREVAGPPPKPAPISRLAMLKRFTDVERKRIRAQAARNEDVQDWLELFNAAQEIRLDDPDTMAGVQSLEAAGLLSPGRAAEILTP